MRVAPQHTVFHRIAAEIVQGSTAAGVDDVETKLPATVLIHSHSLTRDFHLRRLFGHFEVTLVELKLGKQTRADDAEPLPNLTLIDAAFPAKRSDETPVVCFKFGLRQVDPSTSAKSE
jgi:hypothetical protein